MYTFWLYLRNRWPRDAGLRIDHLLLNSPAAARLAWMNTCVAKGSMEWLRCAKRTYGNVVIIRITEVAGP